MNDKQKRFVQEYLKDMNASQAYIRAGYAAKNAHVTSSQLLANPSIAAAIKTAMERRSERTLVTQDMVINELKRIAFGNMSSVATWNESGVTFKDSASLTEDERATIMSVEETTNEHGGSLKVKQFDKMKALELLGKHLGLFAEKVDATHTVTVRDHRDVSNEDLTNVIEMVPVRSES